MIGQGECPHAQPRNLKMRIAEICRGSFWPSGYFNLYDISTGTLPAPIFVTLVPPRPSPCISKLSVIRVELLRSMLLIMEALLRQSQCASVSGMPVNIRRRPSRQRCLQAVVTLRCNAEACTTRRTAASTTPPQHTSYLAHCSLLDTPVHRRRGSRRR